LKKLIKAAGIDRIDFEGKFVAIKMHFGELGNISYLRPTTPRPSRYGQGLGRLSLSVRRNTMYPGSARTPGALGMRLENGFGPLSAGCPVIIGDGLKVPTISRFRGRGRIREGSPDRPGDHGRGYIHKPHAFQGHEMTGFGGTIKNIGMGLRFRAGKTEQHSAARPT
jgi:uncharacterized Fe-S center protein